MDFVLAGSGGLKIYLQKEDGAFADVTAAAGLSALVLSAGYFGVWAADIEADGDLDFVLGPLKNEKVTVLRNNGDGTFAVVQPFEGVLGLRDFAWADLDQDGDPDAALLDSEGIVHFYANERAGRFGRRRGLEELGAVVALAVADLHAGGKIDLVALRPDGPIVRIISALDEQARAIDGVAPAPERPRGTTRLFVADVDNNGALDLIVSGTRGGWIGLRLQPKRFHVLALEQGFDVFDVADFDADGRLDLLGLTSDGKPAVGIGQGSKAYHWQVIRPRAAKVFGDARINSFGLGGEVEVRAGLLVQKQVINGPIMHFGLGDWPRSDVARIVWPNGTVTGGIRGEIRPGDHGRAAAQGLLPVPFCLRRHCRALRHRFHLEVAAGPSDQRTRHRRGRSDRGLGEDPRRPACPARRRL